MTRSALARSLAAALLLVLVLVTMARKRAAIAPETLRPGSVAPDFTLPLLDGGRISLHEGRGHVMVLDFWASWCPPCREELPALEGLQARYRDAVRFLAINTEGEEARGAVADFVLRNHLKLPVALDSGVVAAIFRVEVIPETLVLDRSGRITALFRGPPDGPELERAIAQAIAQAGN